MNAGSNPMKHGNTTNLDRGLMLSFLTLWTIVHPYFNIPHYITNHHHLTTCFLFVGAKIITRYTVQYSCEYISKLTHSVYYSSNEPLRHCLCPCLPIMYWWERICSFLIRAGVLKQMTISWGYRQYLHNVLCVCVCTTIIECIWHHCCNSSTYM